MSFTDAVRTCISKFATFDGRATRSEFWWFYLFAALVGFIGYVPILILTFIGASSNDGAISSIFTILTVIFWIVWLIVVIALYIPLLAVGMPPPARPRAVRLAAAALPGALRQHRPDRVLRHGRHPGRQRLRPQARLATTLVNERSTPWDSDKRSRTT